MNLRRSRFSRPNNNNCTELPNEDLNNQLCSQALINSAGQQQVKNDVDVEKVSIQLRMTNLF